MAAFEKYLQNTSITAEAIFAKLTLRFESLGQ